jgi:crotonobetainyl-CoA:carnitine CoA-transferase CaiB-like acyl-CoA transferase
VARGYVERPDHPVVGERPTFGFPFRMTGVERWLRTPAPTMGQHNEDVLGKVLGLSADELDRLAADQVIGEAPLGV